MKSLLNQLNEVAGKTAYQSYTIVHGIEQIQVLIPLTEAKDFEVSFNSTTDKTKDALLEIVRDHNGKIKG